MVGPKMTPDKLRKVLSLAVFIYSLGLALALLIFGQLCDEMILIVAGYFSLISIWFLVMFGKEKE